MLARECAMPRLCNEKQSHWDELWERRKRFAEAALMQMNVVANDRISLLSFSSKRLNNNSSSSTTTNSIEKESGWWKIKSKRAWREIGGWWTRSTSATSKRIRKPQICAIQKDSWNRRRRRRCLHRCRIYLWRHRETEIEGTLRFSLSLSLSLSLSHQTDFNGISPRLIHGDETSRCTVVQLFFWSISLIINYSVIDLSLVESPTVCATSWLVWIVFWLCNY